MTLENLIFTNLKGTSDVVASKAEPLHITLRNVKTSFDESATVKRLFSGDDNNTIIDELTE